MGWNIHNVLLDLMGGGLSIAQLMIDCAVSVRGGVEWCRIERWGVRRRRRYIRFAEWRSHSNANVEKRWGKGGRIGRCIARLTLDLSTCPLLFVCLFVISRCIYIPSLFNGLMVTGDGGLEGSSWRPRQAIPRQHLHYLRHHLHGPALLPLSRSPAQGRPGAAGGRGGGESRLCQSSFGRRLNGLIWQMAAITSSSDIDHHL